MNVQYSSKQLHVEHKIIVHIPGTYVSGTHLKAVNDSGIDSSYWLPNLRKLFMQLPPDK